MLNKLEREILDISYENKTSHIGSCLTAAGLIDKIYLVKKEQDVFVLSNGHAFLAWAVVLQKHQGKDARDLVRRHGTHPTRNVEDGITVSTGSLGMGITVAVGLAIARPDRDVYILTSDGEMAEGSAWEALRIASDLRLENLKIMVNANGYSALDKQDPEILDIRMQYFYPSLVVRTNTFKYPDFLQGVDAHYVVMDEEMYKSAIK